MTIICSVNYDTTVVYPKQYLKGTVGVQTLHTSLMEFIVIDVIGIASCEWLRQNRFLKCMKRCRYRNELKGYQEFFRSSQILVGGSRTFSLTRDPQIYHFRTFLPEYLPATWSGQFGSIQYVAKIAIKEVDALLQTIPSQIVIKSYRNLNLEKQLLTEVLQKVKRTFRFGFIRLGSVEVTVWMPLCGIAAGQCIPILCTIINKTRIFFDGLVFALAQIEVYRSTYPSIAVKTVRTEICKVERVVDILRGKYEFYAVLETTRDIHPTNQYYRCNSCQLTYEVMVSVKGTILRQNPHGYFSIATPGISIIVGTHPLTSYDIEEVTKRVIAYANESRTSELEDAEEESGDNGLINEKIKKLSETSIERMTSSGS